MKALEMVPQCKKSSQGFKVEGQLLTKQVLFLLKREATFYP